MRRLHFFVCLFLWLSFLGEARADRRPLIEPDTSNDTYTKGRISLQIVSGVLFSLTNLPEGSPTLNYAQTNLRLGWTLASPGPYRGFFRGAWEGLVEISNSIIFEGPGSYMGGITGLLRYNFVQPGWRLIPYVQGGVGIVYNDVYKDEDQQAIGQAIEFTPQCSLGVHYLISGNWSVDAEAMFHHISNAGLAERNRSINALGGFIGVTYYFDTVGK